MPKRSTSTVISVRRYKERYWAVYVNDVLLAVTVYKVGANAIRSMLESLANRTD